MNDRVAKIFAGHMGVCAVLVNVLIERGVISEDDLADRFRQAHDAASKSSGGNDVAHVLWSMLDYLERRAPGGSGQDRREQDSRQ